MSDEMDDSYGGGDTTPDEAPPQSVDEQNADEGEQTAVISNKILSPDGAPLKEGDTITVKVVKNYGDESEIACMSKEDEGGTETESTPEEDFRMMDQEKG